jgi:hypothetical protein
MSTISTLLWSDRLIVATVLTAILWLWDYLNLEGEDQ